MGLARNAQSGNGGHRLAPGHEAGRDHSYFLAVEVVAGAWALQVLHPGEGKYDTVGTYCAGAMDRGGSTRRHAAPETGSAVLREESVLPMRLAHS
jgi:hypothetical protein